MTKPILGQIMACAVYQCPCCGQPSATPLGPIGFTVNKVWDGDDWILLDSWEGHALSAKLERMGVESSMTLWRELATQRSKEQK